MEIQIFQANHKHMLRMFVEFPWQLHRDEPRWIPPLVSQRANLLNPDKNPAWEYIQGQPFIAMQGEEIVGTILPMINHRHNQHWNEFVGWFGFFECIDDQNVANALLSEAEAWLAKFGVTEVRGPQSLTTHDETGLLIENFDKAVLLMPWNPEYYRTLLEGYGYEVHTELYSLLGTRQSIADANMMDRLGKIIKRRIQKGGITIRQFNPHQKKVEFEHIRRVYARAWDKNWGFVPLTDREMDHLITDLGTLVDKRFAFFAEANGQVVGMGIAVPDLNRAFDIVRPRPWIPEWLSLLQVAYHWKIKGIPHLRFALMGVIPEYRELGVEAAFNYYMAESALEHGVESVDCGWILGHNTLVGIGEKLGLPRYKTHAWFSKTI